jgi:chemotaxis protein histidine kinase CheA
MQLARNALAHGIESQDERIAAGKPAIGTIRLTGERNGDWLRVTCEDDGRGVDVESMQKLAKRPLEDEEDVLSLLFLPGLTTKANADFLAGRGVGLDLALSVVRRLGGTVRLSRGRPYGITATMEVPSERWMIEVLWVKAGEHDLALPLGFTGKVARVDARRPPVHLATCIGLPASGPAALSLELALSGVPTVSIGVDGVGGVEECGVRPIPSLVSTAGPFSGAILRGDGALHLLLDATLLAVKAWAVS